MTPWSLRRLGGWAGGLAVLAVVAVLVAWNAVHPPPPGIDAPARPGPGLDDILLVFVPLAILWTLAVLGVRAVRWLRSPHVPRRGDPMTRPGLVVVVVVTVPVVAVCGFLVRQGASRGCGDPRRSILEPIPASVEVLEEVDGSPIAGTEHWRALTVRSTEGLSARRLRDELVDGYEERGWRIGLAYGDGSEWHLTVDLPYRGDLRWDDPGPPLDAVVIELYHQPRDRRGCLKW